MTVPIRDDYLLPLEPDQAVRRGWRTATDREPKGVTWHWTATWDLETCTRLLGGPNPLRKGKASAHYGVGRTLGEGIDRYVALENQSWHAGKNQTLRWDGRPCTQDFKGSRATIGVETVNIGYARQGVEAGDQWIDAATTNGKHVWRIQPWTDEQIEMMIQVGKEIVRRWPQIGLHDHHGHHDVCPGYKEDVAGFPFARVLRGIYDNPSIPDVWTDLWLPINRQRALVALGYDLGQSGPNGDGADGDWGRLSDAALLSFQEDPEAVANGMWTTFTCWDIHDALADRDLVLAAVVQLSSDTA